jgi:subtilisin family serine protease
MRRNLLAALVAGLCGVLLPLSAAAQGRVSQRFETEQINGREAVTREVLVRFNRPIGQGDLAALGIEQDADQIEAVGAGRLFRVRSRSINLVALLARLAARSDVALVEPNYIVRTTAQPNDAHFGELWGLQNSGQSVNGTPGVPGADIHATAAWDLSVGSTDTVVAVIDTGIDYTHPDLSGNVWSAPTAFTVTVAGVTVTCPAGSHGFNAIAMTCDPMDDHNHGTHVAGTIGASGNNGIGVTGVNWTTRLMGVKFLDADGAGTVADAIKALEFAVAVKEFFSASGGANVRVLSNSWGGDAFSQALQDQVAITAAHDMLFVAAAGNNGLNNDLFPTFPGSFDLPNIVAVAATTNTDERAWFSNYGAASVDLGAPGADILSTTIGNTYAFSSGTSMATPHVSGAAALVLSRCALDTTALKEALLGSVDAAPALAGRTTTGGRLNVHSAIYSCIAPPETPTGLTATAGNAQVTLTWSSALGATRYNVKRGSSTGGPYTQIVSGLKAVTYVDTAVVNDTTYYYVVSAENSMGASGDSNEASATPRAPSDLVVPALAAPSSAGAGAAIVLSVTTKNQGGGTADPSTTRIYLSDNLVQDPNDVQLDGWQTVSVLAPGASVVSSVSVTIPSGTAAGRKYFIAKADADGDIAETSEANNSRVSPVLIGPDLVVSSVTAPATAAAGDALTVTDSVKNQGASPSGSSVTRFFLSVNTNLDASDVPLAGNRNVQALAAAEVSSGQSTVTIPPATTAGTYYIIAMADADETVTEALETNNTAARAIQVGPDLRVSSVVAPPTAGAGATVTVTDTTVNQGAAGAGASATRYYLSTNFQLDATDVLLSNNRSVPALPAGGTSTGSTPVTIPATTTSGSYYLLAKADGDDTVAETQEANNVAARLIQVGPDLTVSSLAVPPKAAAGATVNLTDTTTNQGAGSAGASVTRFYLSANLQLDATDVLLSSSRSVPALSPGGSSFGATSVTIPGTTATGQYYVIAKADADGTETETQEGNNTRYGTLAVGPDLAITSSSLPYSIAAGSSVTVNSTVTNQGAGAAGASTVRFYLSSNLVLDASDLVLQGSRAVPALGAGASSAGGVPVTIPAGTAPGGYYLLIKADGDGSVAEVNEGNNLAPKPIQVTSGGA